MWSDSIVCKWWTSLYSMTWSGSIVLQPMCKHVYLKQLQYCALACEHEVRKTELKTWKLTLCCAQALPRVRSMVKQVVDVCLTLDLAAGFTLRCWYYHVALSRVCQAFCPTHLCCACEHVHIAVRISWWRPIEKLRALLWSPWKISLQVQICQASWSGNHKMYVESSTIMPKSDSMQGQLVQPLEDLLLANATVTALSYI